MNWLLLQLAKLNVVRNIAVAFVIALGSIAITWVVNWKAQQNQAPPSSPISAVQPATAPSGASADTAATPTGKATDEDYISEVILAPESYGKLVADFEPRPSGVTVIINGVEKTSNNYSVPVETEGGYRHLIMVKDDGRRHNVYFFSYGCGCEVQTSPDPYRNAIYAEPLRVAARYAKKLCRDCTKLQAVLDTMDSNSESSEKPE